MIDTVYNQKNKFLFTILNNRYIAFFVMFIVVLFSFPANGQSSTEKKSILIYVKDAVTKEPIEAAQARTLLFPAGGTSYDDGIIEMFVESLDDVIEIRAYDYNMQEVAIQGRTEIEILLYSDFYSNKINFDEGLLGGTRSLHNFYGSTNYKNRTSDFYMSADDLLRLNVGGEVRMIDRSGLNGIGADMFIRGLNSVNLNSQPLILLDGVILNNNPGGKSLHAGFYLNRLADINLYDIESITVLKDGTSIYGSKGANGVIKIHTKRGRNMVTKITFNASTGMSQVGGRDIPMMNGDQFRIYASELINTIEGIDQLADYSSSTFQFLNDDPNSLSYIRYHNKTNWKDQVYKNGMIQNYHINVDGGDEMALYSLSLGYTGEDGVLNNTETQRLNVLFNADFNLTNYIDLALNIGFSTVDRLLLDDGVEIYTSPTYLAMIKSPFLNPFTFTTAGTETSDYEDADVFGISNPAAVIGYALNINKHYRLNYGLEPKVKISPYFVLSSQFDFSYDKMKETYYSPLLGVADRHIEGYGISENMFLGQVSRNVALYDDTKLRYKRSFDKIHSVDAIFGVRYHTERYKLEYGEGHNSGSDQKRNLLNEQDYKNIKGVNSSYKYLSTYLHGEYDYLKKYFVGASVAMDGSSRFGRATEGGINMFNRSWGVFPGVQAGWLMSSEQFMSNASFIDLLKLKAGYSISGNDGINPYAAYSYLISERYMDRANALSIGAIGNNSIQWETTYKSNVGLDMTMLKNRLSLSADLFYNRTTNLIVMRDYPEVLGNGHYWSNEGALKNVGGELSANINLLNLKSIKWEVGGNIGHYKNEITSLPSGEFTTNLAGAEILTSVGNPAGVFYGYKTNGVITTLSDEYLASPLKRFDNVANEYIEYGLGDIMFDDVDENRIINSKDKQIIGNPNPDFYGSFNTRIGIGRWSLFALFSYSYGNDIYNHLRATLESGLDTRNQSLAMLNRWTAEGQVTNQPKIAYGDPMGNARFSDRWIEDGSYLKLKNITLSYTLPVRKRALDALEIWASGSNLWTWTNYLGRDPEVTAGSAVLYQGIDYGYLPNVRSVMVGVKVNL